MHTDRSGVGLGYVLSQFKDGKLHPVSCGARSLIQAEKHRMTTERECLAIVESVRKYGDFLLGQPFSIVTDHSSSSWLLKQKTSSSSKLLRWILELQQYPFEINHQPRKAIAHVDGLSLIEYHSAADSSAPGSSPVTSITLPALDIDTTAPILENVSAKQRAIANYALFRFFSSSALSRRITVWPAKFS